VPEVAGAVPVDWDEATLDDEESVAVFVGAVEEPDVEASTEDEVEVEESLEPEDVGTAVEDPRVMPTASQRPSASEIAACKSLPVQAAWMHAKVDWTKAWLWHRQVSSVAEQPPRLALAMHELAQSGNWRRWMGE